MTGCTTSDGQSLTLLGALVGIVQGIVLGLGSFIIVGVAWVLEFLTGWQNRWTGFCMCGVSAFLFKGWGTLVDPTGSFVDWSDMDKNHVSFHDEHVEKPDWLNKDKDKDEIPPQTGEPSPPQTGEPSLPMTGESAIPQTGDSGVGNDLVPGEGEILVTYDLAGGYDGPEDQIFQITGKQKLPKKTPFRPGYHFDGWSTYPGATAGIYGPGEKTDKYLDELRLTEDTTLYAVWVASDTVLVDVDHKYTVTRVKNSPYVTIACSCGLNIVDRTMTREEFMYYYFNDIVADNARGVDKMEKLYKLYLAQDIGPLALQLNTTFYNGTQY